MKIRGNKLLSLIVAFMALLALAGAPARAQDLLAHGTDDVFWIAQVVSTSDGGARHDETVIHARGIGGGQTRWVEVTRLDARAINLAARGSDLVALLSSRNWLILWGTGQITGPPLGGGSIIQTMASDRDTIWAIGIVGSPPSTEPSTTRTATTNEAVTTTPETTTPSPSMVASTTSPAMTAPGELALYQFDRGNWVLKARLPGDAHVTGSAAHVSMTVMSGLPLIALADTDGAIHTYQFTKDDQWTSRGVITPARKGPFKLVNAGPAVLWEGGDSGAGAVHVLGETWSKAIPLKVSMEIRQPQARTIAAVAGSLRLLFADNSKIYEQPFKPDGTSLGSAAELVMPSGNDMNYNWVMIGVFVLLLMALGAAVFRRSVPGKKEE
jgi:hypothetical protein